ncbi:MAG: hypothetical protein AB1630_11255, partial [bacterium]
FCLLKISSIILSIIYIGFLEPKHNKFFEVVNSYGRVAENGNLKLSYTHSHLVKKKIHFPLNSQS